MSLKRWSLLFVVLCATAVSHFAQAAAARTAPTEAPAVWAAHAKASAEQETLVVEITPYDRGTVPAEWSARVGEITAEGALPPDLVRPEGRTRWDLTGLRAQGTETRSVRVIAGRSAATAEGGAGYDVDWQPTGPEFSGPASASPTSRGARDQGTSGAGRLLDPTGGDAAERLLFPERFEDALIPGAHQTLDLEASTPAGADRLRIEIDTVGVGWVHLPSGPRETALQRVLTLRRAAGASGFELETLAHRWVDLRAGVVAEILGTPSADGRERAAITGGWFLEELLTPLATVKLHVSELDTPQLGYINYGWDRGVDTAVSSLTPDHFATIGALTAASTWDFSANTGTSTTPLAGTTTANNSTTITGSGTSFTTKLAVGDRIALSSAPATFGRVTAIASATSLTVATPLGNGTTQTVLRRVREAASTTTAINATETCNTGSCGYNVAGGQFDRRDSNFDTTNIKSNSISQLQNRASDTVIWLRAGSQKEGVSGALGTGESRFCYSPFDDNGDGTISAAENRPGVPEWVLAHNDSDGKGYYLQAGDSFQSQAVCVGGTNPGAACLKPSDCTGGGTCGASFNCVQNVYNEVCGGGGLASHLYSKACSGTTGSHLGKQTIDVVKNGVITLPSGHTFNALLARNVADFCVYTDSGCFIKVDEVRTVTFLWQVPYLGTLVRLQSVQNAADTTSFTTLAETEIEFGLFPPRTITAPSSTNTTVSLSWDPGLDTHRISSYKIYWDTDSGASSAYAFNSVANAGQVAFAGTTATISGLSAGTTYYFTVVSRSTYTDPSSGVITTYESLVYPTQVFGDPGFAYPIEVQKATTGGACVPAAQVQGVTVTKSGGNIQICWSPVSDPCLTGYRILGATNPSSDVNFSTVADVGLTTCWSGTTSLRDFLVVARGAGGTGPWGSFGH